MAVFETVLKSDLKKPVIVQPLPGNVFSGDNGGNKITVEITDNGSAASLSGGVVGYILREDNQTVIVNGSISGNRASIVLPASAYTVIGRISIVVKVGETTVGACTAYVYRTSTDTLVDPGHVVPSLQELLAQIQNCVAATNAANSAASSANSAASNANTKANLANTAANTANTAATNANNKAALADAKATAANTAAGNANTAAAKIDNMTVAAQNLAPGSTPTVQISEVSGHKHVLFGLVKGDKGDKGKDFRIRRTFSSIAQMQAYNPSTDQSSQKVIAYDFVMIDTGSVEDVDTGKLYCYEPEESTVWHYIGDLSGAQGIKGDTGNGIDSIALNNDYTLTIRYTDGSSFTTASIRGATGATGNGISSIELNQDYTLTITMTDGTTYTTPSIRGATGATGATGQTGAAGTSAYVHIRFSALEPTSDSEIKTDPDEWIGIYAGTSQAAPTSYSAYTWYKFKGETGQTGQAGQTGAVPNVTVGNVTTGEPGTSASVTRRSGSPDTAPILDFVIPRGMPGTGAVSSVLGIYPDANGDVPIPVVTSAELDEICV